MANTQTTNSKAGAGKNGAAAAGTKAALALGRRDAKRKVAKVDPFESIITAVPGKEGDASRKSMSFLAGDTLAGQYVRTKRVVSDKFTAGKKNAEGETYRDLHILRDVESGQLFGIWGVGSLDRVLPNLARDQYVEITYVGLAEKPLKPGMNPPHVFEFASDNGIDLEAAASEVTEDLSA